MDSSPLLPARSTNTSSSTVNELDELHARLALEEKIREGAFNLLEVFAADAVSSGDGQQQQVLRKQVEDELEHANKKIEVIQSRIAGLLRSNSAADLASQDPFASAYAQYKTAGAPFIGSLKGDLCVFKTLLADDQMQEAVDVVLGHLASLPAKGAREQLESLIALVRVMESVPTLAFRIPTPDFVTSRVLPA